jgi:DNA-binding MarR family transcriptional regulator
MPRSRADLGLAVSLALRDTVAELSRLNHAVGDQVELNAIDLICLDILARLGPMGPRSLGEQAHVHPATMTGVVDRLERGGWITRAPDPDDRRRVVLRVDRRAGAEIVRAYAPMSRALNDIIAGYSVEQLEAVLSFLTAARDAGHEVMDELSRADS